MEQDKLRLTCMDIENREYYYVVCLAFSSNDPTIYAGGNLNFTINDPSGFTIGKSYDLKLNEIIE